MPIVQVKPGVFPIAPSPDTNAGWSDSGGGHRETGADIVWNNAGPGYPNAEETQYGTLGLKFFVESTGFTIYGDGGLGTLGSKIVIPEGAMINGVLIRHWVSFDVSGGASGPFELRAGIMEPDGKWDVTGFSTVVYPTKNVMPFPTAFQSDVPIVGRITDNTFATGVISLPRNPNTPVNFSFGDGVEIDGTPDFTVGLTAKVQEWIDRPTWNPLDGIIAIVLDPFETQPFPSVDFFNTFCASTRISVALHPELFIDYTPLPVPPAPLAREICGDLEVLPAVSGEIEVTQAVTGTLEAASEGVAGSLDVTPVAGDLEVTPIGGTLEVEKCR